MVTLPALADAEARLRPDPPLEQDVLRFLDSQLGRVLPRSESRGIPHYYRGVVLGERSLEALSVVVRHRSESALPLVDVGSGLGSTVLLACTSGLKAVGVEPGSEELVLARRRAHGLDIAPDVFRAGVGESLPLEDGSVSAVLLHDVLEHVSDWRAVLGEARRALAPGGIVYVKGPSYAVRFYEPHYKLPWLPLLPKRIARPYLRAAGRDQAYLEHIGYRRRGAVLAELRTLGFELAFPRLEKLRAPDSINRPWAQALVERVRRDDGSLPTIADVLAENPLQSTIDVVARLPVR